jgi:predicted GNAT family acetyltransferase
VTEVIEIRDQPERSRYEITLDGRLAGVAVYDLGGADGEITLVHTEVDPAFAGKGLGSRLAKHVLDDIRARGLRVRPKCPFMARYIRSHPAYQDLVIP